MCITPWEAGLVEWLERSPPTNVSWVRFPDPASYVGWVCCWLSTLLRAVFLRVLRFSPLLKNQHFQIPIRSWNARTFLNEFLGTPWCSVGKQITFTFFYIYITFTLLHIVLNSSNIGSFIYSLVFFTFYGYIAKFHSNQHPVGLIAQLVEHCVGIAQVMGSNPVQAWFNF